MTESSQDWKDGFLLVGNQVVLDLLNTKLVAGDQEQEMLTDTTALVRWLLASGLASTPEIKGKLKDWSDETKARIFLRQLLIFRETLRGAVLQLEEGTQPNVPFLADLNARLYTHPIRKAVTAKNGKVQSRQVDGTSVADTLWAALLHHTERLLTDTESDRVRKCEGCVVHFFDVSKKNARRWCSMRLCGNKVKVAAYQDRQRRAEGNSRP